MLNGLDFFICGCVIQGLFVLRVELKMKQNLVQEGDETDCTWYEFQILKCSRVCL